MFVADRGGLAKGKQGAEESSSCKSKFYKPPFNVKSRILCQAERTFEIVTLCPCCKFQLILVTLCLLNKWLIIFFVINVICKLDFYASRIYVENSHDQIQNLKNKVTKNIVKIKVHQE